MLLSDSKIPFGQNSKILNMVTRQIVCKNPTTTFDGAIVTKIRRFKNAVCNIALIATKLMNQTVQFHSTYYLRLFTISPHDNQYVFNDTVCYRTKLEREILLRATLFSSMQRYCNQVYVVCCSKKIVSKISWFLYLDNLK